ncbi:unnamed protein product [Alternaria burnsii]|nr:unnamed protein product [Alternaria burnsii]
MATFTSVAQPTSYRFKHFEPTSLERTQSKPKTKAKKHTLHRDCREVASQSSGSLYQGRESDFSTVPQQITRVQTTDCLEHDEDINSEMYDLFGEDHETSTLEFANNDSDHQFPHELCDEGEKSRETLYLTLNDSFNGSTPDCHSVGESDSTRDHHSATRLQRSNETWDYQDKSCYLTTANGGNHAEQRDNLDATVGYAFSAEDNEITYHVGPAVEDETFSGVASVVKGPPTTQKRSHQSSIADAATTILEAVPDTVSHPEPENPPSAKRRRMAERQAQRPMTESMYTPKPTPLLDPTHQASCLITSDGPILSPPGADDREHGTISLALSSTNHHDVEDGDGAYVQGAVEEQSQTRSSITPFQEILFEQDVREESNKRVISRQGSGSEVGETLEDEHSYDESSIIRPSRSQRPRRTIWTPAMARKPSNTSPRPLDYDTVPARLSQRVKLSQPQRKPVPGRRNTDERPRTCFLESDTPGTTTDHGTDIDYGCDLSMSCRITDLTLCTIPHGSSVVTAMLRPHKSDSYLDVVALGHKVLGEQGNVIRMTQMSSDSWVLLGYRCNDSSLDPCNRRSPNAEWINGFHNDAATYRMDHSDNDDNDHDCDEENEHEEQFTDRYSQRIRKLWLESEELLLLSLKDEQGMDWEEVCERFPGRSLGAIKLRYYTLRKRVSSVWDTMTARGLAYERSVFPLIKGQRGAIVQIFRLQGLEGLHNLFSCTKPTGFVSGNL